jgi:hypothetical protein
VNREGALQGPAFFFSFSDSGVHCKHVFAHAGEKHSIYGAMGVPFDALYEHSNDYDYDYDYEYDYGHASRNARIIINTKTHTNTI